MQYEDMPHRDILEYLTKGVSEALSSIRSHPLENIQIVEPVDEEGKLTKLFQAVIPEEDKKDKKDSNWRGMIIKIIRTPVHKLKNVMFKKMLIRFIAYFYDEKLKSTEKFESFGEFVFSALVKKYMMKRAAENRFHHLLSSCVKYQSISRVRVFGRFLGIYDSLDSHDLNFYLECLNFLNNSPSGQSATPEISESLWIPYIRCLECIKHVGKSIPSESVLTLREDLERLRRQDKQNSKGIVELDEFLERLVDAFSSHKKHTQDFMKIIYGAADLNNDGYLQHREFELLVRFLSEKPFNSAKCNELFNLFAENFMAEDDQQVKAISFINLCQLDQKNEVFNQNLIYQLTRVRNIEEATMKLREIEGNIEEIIEEIHWRLSQDVIWEEHLVELNNLLEILLGKVKGKANPEEVWLGLRLLQEDSKRCIIVENVKDLLPSIGLALYDFDEITYIQK